MSASTARPVAASSASPASKDLGGTPRRFDSLDVARGGALLAMAAYHTTWDLGHLALTPENYALAPLGKFAAHLIAGTFLVLVGIGLVLMNRDGLRPRAFLLRLARIGIAALLITAATIYAFPDSFIFFGILHCIAVSSVLAVPFLRVSPAVALVVGIVVLATPAVMANPDYHLAVFDDPILSFLGLGMVPPRTNDYVPLFPWFGLVLWGWQQRGSVCRLSCARNGRRGGRDRSPRAGWLWPGATASPCISCISRCCSPCSRAS